VTATRFSILDDDNAKRRQLKSEIQFHAKALYATMLIVFYHHNVRIVEALFVMHAVVELLFVKVD